MAKFALAGQKQPGSTFNVSKQFYSAVGTSGGGLAFKGSASGGPSEVTPEEVVQKRPFERTGKVSINLLGKSPKATPPVPVPRPSGASALKASEFPVLSWGPIPDILGFGLDRIAEAPALPTSASVFAERRIEQLQKATPAELQAVGGPELVARRTELAAMQAQGMIGEGQRQAELLRAAVQAEAKARGQSSLLLDEYTVPPANLGEQLMQVLSLGSVLQRTVSRTLFANRFDEVMKWTGEPTTRTVRGQGEFDQPQTITEAPEDLSKELLSIKERFEAGEINEDEARDLIARSSDNVMASRDTPFDVPGFVPYLGGADVGRFIPWLASQVMTDPLSLASIGLGGAAATGARAAGSAVGATRRIIAKEAIDAVEATGRVLVKSEADEIGKTAVNQWVARVEESARNAGEDISTKRLGLSNDLILKYGLRNADTAEPMLKGLQEVAVPLGPTSALTPARHRSRRQGLELPRPPDALRLRGGGLHRRPAHRQRHVAWLPDRHRGRGVRGLIDRYVAKHIGNDAYRIGLELDGIAVGNLARQVGHQQNIAYGLARAGHARRGRRPGSGLGHREERGQHRAPDVRLRAAEDGVQCHPAQGPAAAQALERWREDAVPLMLHVYGDAGLTEAQARVVLQTSSEAEIRVLKFRDWALRVVQIEKAKQRALAKYTGVPTAAQRKKGAKHFPPNLIERVTVLGPGQLNRQAVRDINKALRRGDMAFVRGAVAQYDDLSHNLSLDLEDATLVAQLEVLLKKLRDANLIPEAVPLKSLPDDLQDYIAKYGDNGVALKPLDSDIAFPILNDAGDVIGTSAWLDTTTEAAAVAYKGRIDAKLGKVFMKVSGTQVERSANHRLEKIAGERWSWTQEQTRGVVTALRKAAETGGMNDTPVTIRGLSPEQMYRAAITTRIPHELTKEGFNERSFAEAVVEAWEGDYWSVGLTQKMTGKSKTLTAAGGNWIGRMAENLYPLLRFRYSPFFQLQELFEAPFFLVMRGEFPLRSAAVGTYASAGERLPGRAQRMLPGFEEAKASRARSQLLDEETLAAMERRDQYDGMYKGDMVERSDYVRLSGRAATDIAGVRLAGRSRHRLHQ